jgi:hypothetical protein
MLGSRLHLLPMILKLFDAGASEEDEFLLLSLLNPSLLFSLLKYIEAPCYLTNVLPYLFEYLYVTSSTRRVREKAAESLCRLAQSDALGSAITTRMILPPLLKQLGHSKNMPSWASPSHAYSLEIPLASPSTSEILEAIPDMSFSRPFVLAALIGVCQWLPQVVCSHVFV